MKNIFRIGTLIISLLFVLSAFVGCGEAEIDTDRPEDSRIGLLPIEDLSEYKIVRSDSASEEVKSIVTELRKSLSENFGAELNIGTDFGTESKKEILIGETKRSASRKAAEDITSVSSYTVRKSDDKIVIYGGSEKALRAAIEKWLTKMVNPEGELCIPVTTEKGYVYLPEGVKLDKLTVDGERMMDMTIYADDPVLLIYAKQIKTLISEYADIDLDVISNKIPEKGIILSFDSENYRTESISVENGAIRITPAYGNPKFAYDRLKDILDGAEGRELDITDSVNYSGSIDYSNMYSKDQLMILLEDVYESDAFIVGELLDFGTNKNSTLVSSGLEYFKEVTGEYPSMYSIDVAASFTYIKDGGDEMLHIAEELINYASKGGIIEAHAHTNCPSNPNEWRKGTLDYQQWNELFIDGTELNAVFYDHLSKTADFLKILDDAGVPVIWRPYHEINGNWFWWGAGRKDGVGGTRLEADYYKRLWTVTYEYFTETRGLENLVWVYNPGIGNESETLAAPLYCYPGDEYVDIVGIDWYTNGDYFVLENTSTYKDLAGTGKMVNMCEFGPSGDALIEPDLGETGEQKDLFSCRDVLTYFENMRSSGLKSSYWLFWQGSQAITGMGYGDEFMQSEYTLTLDETAAMLREIMDEK